jgi:hypothetical protein
LLRERSRFQGTTEVDAADFVIEAAPLSAIQVFEIG